MNAFPSSQFAGHLNHHCKKNRHETCRGNVAYFGVDGEFDCECKCHKQGEEIMTNGLIEYIKLYKISLEQDDEKIQSFFNSFEGDDDSDEYCGYEIWDISNGGELHAINHILEYAIELDNSNPAMIG